MFLCRVFLSAHFRYRFFLLCYLMDPDTYPPCGYASSMRIQEVSYNADPCGFRSETTPIWLITDCRYRYFERKLLFKELINSAGSITYELRESLNLMIFCLLIPAGSRINQELWRLSGPHRGLCHWGGGQQAGEPWCHSTPGIQRSYLSAPAVMVQKSIKKAIKCLN